MLSKLVLCLILSAHISAWVSEPRDWKEVDVTIIVSEPKEGLPHPREEWRKAGIDIFDVKNGHSCKTLVELELGFAIGIRLQPGEYVINAKMDHSSLNEVLVAQKRCKISGRTEINLVLEKPMRHMLKTQFLNMSGEPLAGYEIQATVCGGNAKLEKQNPDSKDFVYITDEKGFSEFAFFGALPVTTELSLRRYKYRNCKPITIPHTSWDSEDVFKVAFDAKPIGVLKLAVEVKGEIYPLEEGLNKIAEVTKERRSNNSIDLSLYVFSYERKGRWYGASGTVASSEIELIGIPDGEYAFLQANSGGLYFEPRDNFPIVIKNRTIVKASEPLVLVRQREFQDGSRGLYVEVTHKNKPVSNVHIDILYPDRYYSGKTGADGSVRINAPAGKYRLTAKHEMYKPVVMDLTLTKAEGNRIDIKMERISLFARIARHEDIYIVGLIVVGVLIYIGITIFFIYRSYKGIRHKTKYAMDYEDSLAKMSNRRGEKAGWIGGWMGSFLWLFIFVFVWLFHRRYLGGLVCFGIYALAMLLVFVLSPWRNPDKKYWILILPLFIIFLGSAIVAIIVFGGIRALGRNLWVICFIIPLAIPLCSIGRKRWKDGENLSNYYDGFDNL